MLITSIHVIGTATTTSALPKPSSSMLCVFISGKCTYSLIKSKPVTPKSIDPFMSSSEISFGERKINSILS